MNLRQFRILLAKEIRYIERDWRTLLILFIAPVVFLALGFFAGALFLRTAGNAESEDRQTANRHFIRVATLHVPESSLLIKALRAQRRIRLIRSADPLADLKKGRCDVVLESPTNALESLRQLKSIVIRIHYDVSVELPLAVVGKALNEYENDEMRARLGDLSLSTDYLKPVKLDYVGVVVQTSLKAYVDKQKRLVFEMIGLLILVLVWAGCMSNYLVFYLEREEGTLETLLSNPVRPWEVLLSKWCAILVFTILQMALYAILLVYSAQVYGVFEIGRIMPLSITALDVFLLVACVFQASMFFYALLLMVCCLVQSAREANSAMTLVGGMAILIGAVPLLKENSPWIFGLLPGGGLGFAIKEVLSGFTSPGRWDAAVLSNVVYTAGLLWIGCRLLAREESVLGGVSALRLALPRARLTVRAKPSVPEAFLYAILALTLFLFASAPLQLRSLGAGLLVSQLTVFLLLPLGLAAYWKLDLIETFRLRWPSIRSMICAFLLCVGCFLILPLLTNLQNLIVPTPPAYQQALKEIFRKLAAGHSLAVIVAFGAVLPGLCEELAFRGFILSGLSGSWRPWWAAIVSALLFAGAHLDPYKFAPIFLMGILLATLALRSGSIIPGMFFHVLNNGTAIWLAVRPGGDGSFGETLAPRAGQTNVLWIMALIGLMIIGRTLRWLFRPPSKLATATGRSS